jgi:hypothetical protein
VVSTYGYITLANLEAYTGIDYSAVNATKYSDANVEAIITIAERLVNAHCMQSFSTATDAVFAATIEVASRLMHNKLHTDGYEPDTDEVKVWDVVIDTMLMNSIYSPIDLIPTQGIDK